MKGIILAGGNGTRLLPMTRVTNKHLLPIYDRPMILFPLETLKQAGIEDIIIVSGKGHAGHFLELLGSGKSYGVNLRYAVQDEAGGIAQALSLAEEFIDGEDMAVILGDNIFQKTPSFKFDGGAKLFLKQVPDPHRFGVPRILDNQVVEVIEKPAEPPSDFAVTGLYLYDSSVFDKIRTLKPSARNELEVTDINNLYIKENNLWYNIIDGWWQDAGTPESLYKASTLVRG